MEQKWLTISIMMSLACTLTSAQLIKDRSVRCLSDSMEVEFEFSQPFEGVVYANKHYESPDCRWTGQGGRSLVTRVPLNPQATKSPYCGVQVDDSNGDFSVMLVISPMKGILVDGMAGLQVRCAYNTGDVTLTLPSGPNGSGIFISPQTQAGVVTGSGGSPFLLMVIRDGHGINGQVVQAASVGQRITIDVVMQDTTIYDFYVHDCYAHDGTNTPDASISVVDTNGCAVRLSRAVDVPVFTTPPVAGGAKHVYVHMYGFQFTTSQFVYFECQVRPCLQSCNRAQCEADGGARQKRQTSLQAGNNTLATRQVEDDNDYRLQFKLYIDPARAAQNNLIPARDEPLPSVARAGPSEQRICINLHVAVAILIIFVIVCIVSLAITAYMCYRAQKETKSIYPRIGYYTPSSTPSQSQRVGLHSPCTSSSSYARHPGSLDAITVASRAQAY